MEGAVIGPIAGIAASAGALMMAWWGTKAIQKEIAQVSEMGVGGTFGVGLRALLRFEPHFWVFVSGAVAGITLMGSAFGTGE